MQLILKILLIFIFLSPYSIDLYAQWNKKISYKVYSHQINFELYDSLVSKTFIYPQLAQFDNKTIELEVNTFLFQQFIPKQEELYEDLFPENQQDESVLALTQLVDFNVNFSHPHFVSIQYDNSVEYEGMPHAQWNSEFYNFDLRNGNRLESLDQLLIPQSDSVLNRIYNQYHSEFRVDDIWLVIEKQEFYIFENNASDLWLGIYIAPYKEYYQKDGTIANNGYIPSSFEIPLEKVKSIIKQEFAFLFNKKSNK